MPGRPGSYSLMRRRNCEFATCSSSATRRGRNSTTPARHWKRSRARSASTSWKPLRQNCATLYMRRTESCWHNLSQDNTPPRRSNAWRCAAPLARLIVLLGSWCHGEPRSGRPLPRRGSRLLARGRGCGSGGSCPVGWPRIPPGRCPLRQPTKNDCWSRSMRLCRRAKGLWQFGRGGEKWPTCWPTPAARVAMIRRGSSRVPRTKTRQKPRQRSSTLIRSMRRPWTS